MQSPLHQIALDPILAEGPQGFQPVVALDQDVFGAVGADAYRGGLAVFQHVLGNLLDLFGLKRFHAFAGNADIGDEELLLFQHGRGLTV